MILALLLMFQFTFASVGQALPASKVQFESTSDHPSCGLLKHRAKERAKVIRELVYLMDLEEGSPVKKVLEENTLINNKFFLDKELWTDYGAKVSFEVSVTPELTQAIANHGYNQLFFAIAGPGLNWISHPHQMLEEIDFQYSAETSKIRVQYPIYVHAYCNDQDKTPIFNWYGPQDNLTTTIEVRSQLAELME